MSRRTELFLLSFIVLTPACDNHECSGAPDPPGVIVVDSASARPICEATVEVRDGDHVQTLRVSEYDPEDCIARFESRPGAYVVTASAPGYRTNSTDMRVRTDRCGYTQVEPSGPMGRYPGYAFTVTLPLDPM